MALSSNVFVPDEVIQIGAGGSGSRIAAEMCFFFRGNYRSLRNSWYTLIDHDRLSSSNLNRQLYFFHECTDATKGQTLVKRYRDMFPIRQIPEPINADTLNRVFDADRLSKKLVVICAADNPLVVRQSLEKLMNEATNDWYWIFTGANLVQRDVAGVTIQTGSGQAYAYGKMRGVPLYPIPPTQVLTDIMEATGYGPTSSGQGCGVTNDSGAQTPLMNDSCATYTMQLINLFFEHGVFIPCVYFTDGVEVTYGDASNVEDLFRRTTPEETQEETSEETEEVVDNEVVDESADSSNTSNVEVTEPEPVPF